MLRQSYNVLFGQRRHRLSKETGLRINRPLNKAHWSKSYRIPSTKRCCSNRGRTLQVQRAQAGAVVQGEVGDSAVPERQRLHLWELQTDVVCLASVQHSILDSIADHSAFMCLKTRHKMCTGYHTESDVAPGFRQSAASAHEQEQTWRLEPRLQCVAT